MNLPNIAHMLRIKRRMKELDETILEFEKEYGNGISFDLASAGYALEKEDLQKQLDKLEEKKE